MKAIEEQIEFIIRQYPNTDDCEFKTLGELREWQISELKKLLVLPQASVNPRF